MRTEEKGTDVNLATALLCDAFRGQFEAAVVVSDDSDLAEAVRVVREELGFPVGVINPSDREESQLEAYAAFVIPLTRSHLVESQETPLRRRRIRRRERETAWQEEWREELEELTAGRPWARVPIA
jgi:hypothetical protein